MDEELNRREKALKEIVISLAKAAKKHGENLNVKTEWDKLQALEIPFETYNGMHGFDNNTCTEAMWRAKKLSELLVSLIEARNEKQAQNVWESSCKDWIEWANIITANDSSLMVLTSPEDNCVIRKMAEHLSREARKAWAWKKDHQMEVVEYLGTKKSQGGVVEITTDYYRKCEWILYVRCDDPRVMLILNWMEKTWTEKNGYPGFTEITPMPKKIRAFCLEDSNIWTQTSQGPHARFIETYTCTLTPEDNAKYMNVWSGGDKVRMGVMSTLILIFHRNVVASDDSTITITKTDV